MQNKSKQHSLDSSCKVHLLFPLDLGGNDVQSCVPGFFIFFFYFDSEISQILAG